VTFGSPLLLAESEDKIVFLDRARNALLHLRRDHEGP